MKLAALVLTVALGGVLAGCGGQDEASSPLDEKTTVPAVPMDGDAVLPPACPAGGVWQVCDVSTKRNIGTHSSEYGRCWTNESKTEQWATCTAVDSAQTAPGYTYSSFCVQECPAPPSQ